MFVSPTGSKDLADSEDDESQGTAGSTLPPARWCEANSIRQLSLFCNFQDVRYQ